MIRVCSNLPFDLDASHLSSTKEIEANSNSNYSLQMPLFLYPCRGTVAVNICTRRGSMCPPSHKLFRELD